MAHPNEAVGRWLGPLAAFAVAVTLSGCGGSDDDASATDAETSTSTNAAPASTSTTAAGSTTAPDSNTSDSSAEPQEELAEVLSMPAGPAEFPLLGGIELELPVDSSVVDAGGCVIIDVAGYDGTSPFPPYLVIADIRFSGFDTLEPVAGIGDWLALYEGEPEPQPGEESMTALGHEFASYRAENAFPEVPPPSSFLNCTVDDGVVSDTGFIPAVFSDVFVAETDDSVLFLAASGYTESEQREARALFDEIVPTLELADS